jgi:hypothetical protein
MSSGIEVFQTNSLQTVTIKLAPRMPFYCSRDLAEHWRIAVARFTERKNATRNPQRFVRNSIVEQNVVVTLGSSSLLGSPSLEVRVEML